MKASSEIQPSTVSSSQKNNTNSEQGKYVEDLDLEGTVPTEYPEGETEFQYETEKQPAAENLEDVFEPPRRTHWVMTTFLMISYLIGVGVLSLPSAFVSLGWVPGVLLLTGIVFITTVTGLYMWKLHMKYPHIRNYSAMYYHFFGKTGQIIGGTLTYLMFFGIMTADFLTAALSWKSLFQGHHVCVTVWFVIPFAVALVIGQLRSLHGISWVAFVGALCIFLPIVMTCSKVPELSKGAHAYTTIAGDSFVNGVVAMTDIVFAFAGHLIFYEFMAEMKDVRDFPKSLLVSQLVGFVFCMFTAAFVYVYLGNTTILKSPVTLSLPHDALRDAINVILIIHVTAPSVMGGNVLTRAVQRWLQCWGRRKFEDTSLPQRLSFFFWSLIVYGAGFLVACAIPFFNELIGLLAALVGSSNSFGMPAVMYLIQFRRSTSWWNWILALSCIAIGYALLGIGSYAGVYTIIQAVGNHGTPFSCDRVI
jgi:amino acid permease